MINKEDPSISRREFLKLTALSLLSPITKEIKSPCLFFSHGDLNSNKVAITVDDGWYPKIVELMVKKSEELKIPISAFPVGSVIINSPELWRNVFKSGVEIYNHTQNHRNLGDLENSKKEQELKEWENTYQKTFGEEYKNKVIRPPFGNGIERDLFNIAQKLDYLGIASWSVGSKGYSSTYSPDEVFEGISEKITSGSIILLHFVQNDLEILPRIAEVLEEKKLQAVPLSKLPGIPIYSPFPSLPANPKQSK
jgi:peptidoglycan/xylan/chitin deacetylase (PgdA/CDA1 family)